MTSPRIFKRSKSEKNSKKIEENTANFSENLTDKLLQIGDFIIRETQLLVEPAHDALSDLIVQINRIDRSKIDEEKMIRLDTYLHAVNNLIAEQVHIALNDNDKSIKINETETKTIADILADIETCETKNTDLWELVASGEIGHVDVFKNSVTETLALTRGRCLECAEVALNIADSYACEGDKLLNLPEIPENISIGIFKFIEPDHAFLVMNYKKGDDQKEDDSEELIEISDWGDDTIIVDPFDEMKAYTLGEARAAVIERKEINVFKRNLGNLEDNVQVQKEYHIDLCIGSNKVNVDKKRVEEIEQDHELTSVSKLSKT